MGALREALLETRHREQPFDFDPIEIHGTQIAAANEMFGEMVDAIPVLQKAANVAGKSAIQSTADLVPLLFSHTTYKSYPDSFVKARQWKRLAQWLGMVGKGDYRDIDVADATDIDDFLRRLWAAGLMVTTSSGTGGKVSLLPRNQRDHDLYRESLLRFRGWPEELPARNQFHFFLFGPRSGAYTAAYAAGHMIDGFARPDSTHVLVDEPISIARVTRMAELRARMKEGTASPSEIQAAKVEAEEQTHRSEARLDEMIEKLVSLRHEPCFVMGMAAQMFEVVERARKLGVPDGDFHPDTLLSAGGGAKHFKLPPDFNEQIRSFFGNVKVRSGYGMSELTWLFPRCASGRYHMNPYLIPMVLREEGDALVGPQEGIVEGRFAFLDLMAQERWGGTISGDKVKIDFSGTCPCGIRGSTVLEVARYADLKGDDKIQCSGTIDAYIRGSFGPEV